MASMKSEREPRLSGKVVDFPDRSAFQPVGLSFNLEQLQADFRVISVAAAILNKSERELFERVWEGQAEPQVLPTFLRDLEAVDERLDGLRVILQAAHARLTYVMKRANAAGVH
jgi:hypothetical protein